MRACRCECLKLFPSKPHNCKILYMNEVEPLITCREYPSQATGAGSSNVAAVTIYLWLLLFVWLESWKLSGAKYCNDGSVFVCLSEVCLSQYFLPQSKTYFHYHHQDAHVHEVVTGDCQLLSRNELYLLFIGHGDYTCRANAAFLQPKREGCVCLGRFIQGLANGPGLPLISSQPLQLQRPTYISSSQYIIGVCLPSAVAIMLWYHR